MTMMTTMMTTMTMIVHRQTRGRDDAMTVIAQNEKTTNADERSNPQKAHAAWDAAGEADDARGAPANAGGQAAVPPTGAKPASARGQAANAAARRAAGGWQDRSSAAKPGVPPTKPAADGAQAGRSRQSPAFLQARRARNKTP